MCDSDQTNQKERLLEAWKVSEDVAMHFNNLLLGFRLKAIGGIAIGAVATIGLKSKDLGNPWIVFGLFAGLTVIWALVWAADFLYYYRLLAGAVDELLRLERKLGDIHLSHLIERRVRGEGPNKVDIEKDIVDNTLYPGKYPSWPIWAFYVIPAIALIICAVYTLCLAFSVENRTAAVPVVTSAASANETSVGVFASPPLPGGKSSTQADGR